METYFNVEGGAIAIDIALVECVCGRKIPRSQGVNALHHGIEGVMLHRQRYGISAPSLTIRPF